MRLKDRLTGKVGDYFLTNHKKTKIAVVLNGKSPSEGIVFDTLAELCERFESAPEEVEPFEEVAEPKYSITMFRRIYSDGSLDCRRIKIPDDAVFTGQIDFCPKCLSAVKVFMDADGQRWCGKGKHRLLKGKLC